MRNGHIQSERCVKTKLNTFLLLLLLFRSDSFSFRSSEASAHSATRFHRIEQQTLPVRPSCLRALPLLLFIVIMDRLRLLTEGKRQVAPGSMLDNWPSLLNNDFIKRLLLSLQKIKFQVKLGVDNFF